MFVAVVEGIKVSLFIGCETEIRRNVRSSHEQFSLAPTSAFLFRSFVRSFVRSWTEFQRKRAKERKLITRETIRLWFINASIVTPMNTNMKNRK